MRTICEHTSANLATYQANQERQLKRHALSCFLWRDATYVDRESLYADAVFKEILKNTNTKQYSTHTADSFLIQLTSAYLRQCLAQCIPRKQDCSHGPVFRCCLLTQRGSVVQFLLDTHGITFNLILYIQAFWRSHKVLTLNKIFRNIGPLTVELAWFSVENFTIKDFSL